MSKYPLILLTLSALLIGCSSSLTNTIEYYQFQQPISAMQREAVETNQQLRITSVQLRGALNNRGIALVVAENQVHAANYHLWSEAPDLMLSASAQQQLFTALPNWIVVKGYPVITDTEQQRYYELEYELEHFNGDNKGNAVIAGQWRLFYFSPDSGRQLKSINYFNQTQPLLEDDYQGLVDALEKNWQQINQQIAKQLTETI